ncbi:MULTISPECIES: YciI family protein [Lysobacter]|uniref:YciI family protein n=1 Tax=Lysobacter TaxID=68 RepID=UPI001F3DEF81|nr:MULTISPECIES: YciI family protein [Lysobacter]UJB17248.1 YciI family protein [Lysobacter capsici]UJQ29029.1 YciI family protein [Lysobacter gummosus]
MRFLSLIRINETTSQPPTERLLTDMGKLMEQMTREGVLIETAGLKPSAEGVRLRLRGGKVSATDGPFTEAKEVIGGYAMLEAKTKEEAIAQTRRFLEVHGDEWDIECELRPLQDDGRCGGGAATAN